MSLRGRTVEQAATLPDGREARVTLGILEDPYLPRREIDTVTLELRVDEEIAVSLTTVLAADQDSEARALARELAEGLSSGEIEPTPSDLEPFANRLP